MRVTKIKIKCHSRIGSPSHPRIYPKAFGNYEKEMVDEVVTRVETKTSSSSFPSIPVDDEDNDKDSDGKKKEKTPTPTFCRPPPHL